LQRDEGCDILRKREEQQRDQSKMITGERERERGNKEKCEMRNDITS
jgi:hypothetical protein